jgi:hypothetical protein
VSEYTRLETIVLTKRQAWHGPGSYEVGPDYSIWYGSSMAVTVQPGIHWYAEWRDLKRAIRRQSGGWFARQWRWLGDYVGIAIGRWQVRHGKTLTYEELLAELGWSQDDVDGEAAGE